MQESRFFRGSVSGEDAVSEAIGQVMMITAIVILAILVTYFLPHIV